MRRGFIAARPYPPALYHFNIGFAMSETKAAQNYMLFLEIVLRSLAVFKKLYGWRKYEIIILGVSFVAAAASTAASAAATAAAAAAAAAA